VCVLRGGCSYVYEYLRLYCVSKKRIACFKFQNKSTAPFPFFQFSIGPKIFFLPGPTLPCGMFSFSLSAAHRSTCPSSPAMQRAQLKPTQAQDTTRPLPTSRKRFVTAATHFRQCTTFPSSPQSRAASTPPLLSRNRSTTRHLFSLTEPLKEPNTGRNFPSPLMSRLAAKAYKRRPRSHPFLTTTSPATILTWPHPKRAARQAPSATAAALHRPAVSTPPLQSASPGEDSLDPYLLNLS
jgi:hypothetical protein